MSKRPSFQFYPMDWLSDYKVAAMTPAQRGGYIQMLCHMWNTDKCELPKDEGLWQSLSGLTGEDLRVVQGCFNQSPTTPQALVHKRLNEERKKQDFWRQKSAEGGRKSGLVRSKRKGGLTKREPKGNTSSSSSSSNIKENNKEKFLDFVKLTKDEHKKLVEQFGEVGASQRIHNLNEYIGSKGDKYKNHYFTILSWARKETPNFAPPPLNLMPTIKAKRLYG